MLGTTVLSSAMPALLAADPATLNAGAGSEPKVILLKADFAEDRSLILVANVSEATFTGYAAKAAGAGVSPVDLDPITGERVITIKEPAGGWRWVVTGGALPETIYGYALVDAAKTNIFALRRFDHPVVLAAIGHFVHVGDVTLQQVLNPLN